MSDYTEFNSLKSDLSSRMDKTVSVLKDEFSGLRAGRAHTSLLDGIMVDAYGSPSPMNAVGTVNIPDPRTISIQVWDRGLAKAVEKAIRESDLGLNPMSDGQLIRIPIPPLSEERRKELTKVAGKYSEQAKIAIRNIRRDGMDAIKKMEKDNHTSEDDTKRNETTVQKLTDEHVKKVDELYASKEADILQV